MSCGEIGRIYMLRSGSGLLRRGSGDREVVFGRWREGSYYEMLSEHSPPHRAERTGP